jgi:hypothetical protein
MELPHQHARRHEKSKSEGSGDATHWPMRVKRMAGQTRFDCGRRGCARALAGPNPGLSGRPSGSGVSLFL